jgi:two-component system cell cycle response regulator CpdR
MINATILLVASDSLVRVVIQEALEHSGYSVFAAGELGTAMDKLKESTPDLLMVTPYVEDISGYQAARFIRTKCPGLRVLVVGGLIDDDRLQNRLTLAEFDVFPKPYSLTDLLQKVKDVLPEK